MEPTKIISPHHIHMGVHKPIPESLTKETTFQGILSQNTTAASPAQSHLSERPVFDVIYHHIPQASLDPVSKSVGLSAYRAENTTFSTHGTISSWQKYKDDQLLSNPGGDHYYWEHDQVVLRDMDQQTAGQQVGKDISDAVSNVKNCFADLLMGSPISYRDADGAIHSGTQRGLVGSVVDFFKDVGSAVSFGTWRPDGEQKPQGFFKRCGFFLSKMKEALFGDLIQGVSGSVIHMAEDLLFAGWNLAETIPDATIGQFRGGRKLTTAVFDTGQVVMDYLTDVLPGGEAWVRVHSWDLFNKKLPGVHNASLQEYNDTDIRWKYVRNTPFRKSLETIGSLVSDVLSLKFLGRLGFFGEDRHRAD